MNLLVQLISKKSRVLFGKLIITAKANLFHNLDITGWIKTYIATMAISKDPRRFRKLAKPSKIYGKLKENVNQYLLNTSLHGLRYIGEVKISFLERFESGPNSSSSLFTMNAFNNFIFPFQDLLSSLIRFRIFAIHLLHFEYLREMVSHTGHHYGWFAIDFRPWRSISCRYHLQHEPGTKNCYQPIESIRRSVASILFEQYLRARHWSPYIRA